MKSDLAKITTVEEQMNLMEYLKKTFPEQQSYWVGAKKFRDDAAWKWASGESIIKEDGFVWVHSTLARWSKVNCLALHPGVGPSYQEPGEQGYCPHGCTTKYAYVCEKND